MRRGKKVSDQVLDNLVRRYVRLISGGYCKRCKKYVGIYNIATAHLYKRGRKTVRWDLRNVVPLCDNYPIGMRCHYEVDNDPLKMASFMHDILSEDNLNDLQRIANMTLKTYPIDRDEIASCLKAKINLLLGYKDG